MTIAFVIALVSAAVAPPPPPPPASPAAGTRAFDSVTAVYRTATGNYCIRSGWRLATTQTGRRVLPGDCRSGRDWAKRGLTFNHHAAPRARHIIEVSLR